MIDIAPVDERPDQDTGLSARSKQRPKMVQRGELSREIERWPRSCSRCGRNLDREDTRPFRGYFCSYMCAMLWWAMQEKIEREEALREHACDNEKHPCGKCQAIDAAAHEGRSRYSGPC